MLQAPLPHDKPLGLTGDGAAQYLFLNRVGTGCGEAPSPETAEPRGNPRGVHRISGRWRFGWRCDHGHRFWSEPIRGPEGLHPSCSRNSGSSPKGGGNYGGRWNDRSSVDASVRSLSKPAHCTTSGLIFCLSGASLHSGRRGRRDRQHPCPLDCGARPWHCRVHPVNLDIPLSLFPQPSAKPATASLPRDPFLVDLRRAHPDFAVHCIFDVGANIGQSVDRYRRACPAAVIHAFEPVRQSHAVLLERFGHDAGVHCRRLALGSTVKIGALMRASGTSTDNHLLEGTPRPGLPVESVEVSTGEAYCSAHDVDRIDFLKIDAEGHDMEVLKGFLDLLQDHRIGFVQVEASMNPGNRRHVP